VYHHKQSPKPTTHAKPVDGELAEEIRRLIQQFPTFGYRRIWAMLRRRLSKRINRKKVYRIMKLQGWLMHQRQKTPRPRVKGKRSVAKRSNERWAMDVTHISCGPDGWAHLVAIVDCHDRQCIGYEFSLRGRAKEAERALEAACLRRFGTLYSEGPTRELRID
jgi:putative transposase